MQLKNYNIYFFFAVLIGVTVLAYFIIKPFLVAFLVAAILAHLFSPVYKFLLKIFSKKGLSSGITCFLAALVIIIPVVLILSLLISEVNEIIEGISKNPDAPRRTVENFVRNLEEMQAFRFFDIQKIISQETIVSGIKNLSQNVLLILQATYKGVAHFIFVTFVVFFSLFYLLIDGPRLVKKIMAISPLKNSYESMLVAKFNSIVRATIKGTSLIAIIQGTLGGLLFWAAGVSSPVLLGILMIISSVIPSVGSGLIWFPVGIFMLLAGNPTAGIAILLFGMLVISTIDNFLRPRLVGRDTQMHPLLILFSTLGGIALFGIVGFIVGPIIMSLFVALWDIYALEFKEQLEEFNQ